MFPHLLYSAKLFQVLSRPARLRGRTPLSPAARCRIYAEKLLFEPQRAQTSHASQGSTEVIPLLLRAVNPNGPPPRARIPALRSARREVETDYEGRRLVLEALWSLARFRLWPDETDEAGQDVSLMCDDFQAERGNNSTKSVRKTWKSREKHRFQVTFLCRDHSWIE